MNNVRQTVGSSFDMRANGLNSIRLLLAVAVVVSHSWLVSGVGAEPEFGGLTLGQWAVVGFFIISGFLITASLNNTSATFFAARAARIIPGYVAALVLTAFVIAPASSLMTGNQYRVDDATVYVARNVPLYPPYLYQPGIADTLHGLPRPDAWMGPAWTLFWECFNVVADLAFILAPIPLAIVLFKIAAVRPLARMKLRTDVSYGVYIYGNQVQQILAAAVISYHLPIGVGVFAGLSVVGAVVFGVVSWRCVERPALNWNRRRQRDRAGWQTHGPSAPGGERLPS